MYPTFLPPTSLPRLSTNTSLHSISVCRPSPKACDVTSPPLSPRAHQLFQQQLANPLFDHTLSPPHLSLLLSNLQSSNEYVSLSQLPPPQTSSSLAADAIRQHSSSAIATARAAILEKFPGIDKPGGALYPEHRSRACWRDMREFARVVGYGVACGKPVFSDVGLDIMRLLYTELAVPLDAMRYGMEVMAADIVKHCGDDDVRVETGKGFANLLEVLERF